MTGAGRYVIELAKRLPRLSNDFEIHVLLLEGLKSGVVAEIMSDAGAILHYANTAVASARQWVTIPFTLKRIKADLYHYPFLDLPLVPTPAVVTIYDLNPIESIEYFGQRGGLKRVVARAMVHSTLRRAKVAIAISDATRAALARFHPTAQDKLRTIHLGVESARTISSTANDRACEANQWGERPYVLYVGVDRPHKNLPRLVKAFERLRARSGYEAGKGPYLWLAGVGIGSNQLRDQIRQSKLELDIRLDGALSEDELERAYRGARLLAYVSTSEGFGLPILEAFARGVPVLAGDATSLPEVGGDAALYANAEDDGAIAEGLERLFNDDVLRRDLVQRGLRRSEAFSWDATAVQTMNAYSDAARGWKEREDHRR